MRTIEVKTKNGTDHYLILNPKKDKCPICDTKLTSVSFEWQMFHGSAKANCCGAPYQLKSYHADVNKVGQEMMDYIDSLNSPERIELSLDIDMIEPIRQACKELDVIYIQTQAVADRARQILGE